MTNLSVLYPYSPDVKFDMEYYLEKHMPMVKDIFGDAVQSYSVYKGASGVAAGSNPAYCVITNIFFNLTSEETIKVFNENLKPIGEDIPKFTNADPVLQVSEAL